MKSSKRAAASRRICSRPPKPGPISPTGISPSPAPTARSTCSRSRWRRGMTQSLPAELRSPLAGIGEITSQVASFPHGFHVSEVEIDPDTGAVEIVRYTAVDDVGRTVNPMVLHGQTHGGQTHGGQTHGGQTHGGIAQGAG